MAKNFTRSKEELEEDIRSYESRITDMQDDLDDLRDKLDEVEDNELKRGVQSLAEEVEGRWPIFVRRLGINEKDLDTIIFYGMLKLLLDEIQGG